MFITFKKGRELCNKLLSLVNKDKELYKSLREYFEIEIAKSNVEWHYIVSFCYKTRNSYGRSCTRPTERIISLTRHKTYQESLDHASSLWYSDHKYGFTSSRSTNYPYVPSLEWGEVKIIRSDGKEMKVFK